MQANDLVRLFSSNESGPIDICDDINPAVRAAGDFEIYFWPVQMDSQKLKGRIIDETYPSPDGPKRMVSIDYSNGLPNPVARLVCTKELIHILDPIDQRVTSDQAVNELIDKIILPSELQSLDDGDTVWGDRYGYLYALAVLFPWATREIFRPKYEAGELTIDEISDLVELPVEFCFAVMSQHWPRIHHLLTR